MSFNVGDYTITDFVDFEITEPTEEETKEIEALNKERDSKIFPVLPIKKVVSQAEVDVFVRNYPRHLTVDVCRISDPPSVNFYDKKLSPSIFYAHVAHKMAWDDNPESYFYKPKEERKGWIISNIEEVFKNKNNLSEEEINLIDEIYDNKISAVRAKYKDKGKIVMKLTDIKPYYNSIS